MKTYKAIFGTEVQALAAQRDIQSMYVTEVKPEPFNGWLLIVQIPDDGSGSMHVNPEQFDIVVEIVMSHGGKPVEGKTASMDNTTHHLVPKSGVPTCIYCKKTRSELAKQHGDEDVTQHTCPDSPR